MTNEKKKIESLYNCGDHKIEKNSTVLANDSDVKGKYQTY